MIKPGIYIFLSNRAIQGPFERYGKWKTNCAFACGFIDGMKIANQQLYKNCYLVEILPDGKQRKMEYVT